MTDFTKINFKFLIPTEEKNKELLVKMKLGEVINAKVAETSKNGKVLINIKGTEVMAETSRELKKGDVISVSAQIIDKEKIVVKIEEQIQKNINSEIKEKSLGKTEALVNELKNTIKSQAVQDKIYINEKKIDKVIEKYFEIKNTEMNRKNSTLEEEKNINYNKLLKNDEKGLTAQKRNNFLEKENIKKLIEEIKPEIVEKGFSDMKNEKNILKTLMLMEKYDIKYSEDGFKYINTYLKKENLKSISTDEDTAKNIKEMVAELKNSKEDIDKGTNIINSFNQIDEKKQLEFVLNLNKSILAEVKINYESDKKNSEQPNKENFNLNLKLSLENLGEMEIKTTVWNKHMGITFGVDNREKIKIIMEKVNELNSRLNGMGYVIDEINGRVEEKKEEVNIRGVNIKG